MRKIRPWVQGFLLVAFVVLFVRARFPYAGAVPSDLFLRFSPLIALSDLISRGSFSASFLPAAVLLVLTILLGRFFCAWTCPLGALFDLVGRLLPKGKGPPRDFPGWMRSLNVLILASGLLLGLLSVQLLGLFDPLSFLNRVLTLTIFPLFTRTMDAVFGIAKAIPIVGGPVEGFRRLFKSWIMPEPPGSFTTGFWTGVIFLVILLLEKLQPRFWCTYVCPLGALLGIASRRSQFRRKVDDTCVSCGACVRACPMRAIPAEDPKPTDPSSCTFCLDCTGVCPGGIHAISFSGDGIKAPTPLLPDRRRFLIASGGAIIGAGLSKIELYNRENDGRLIRPPGSLPEAEFLERCVRCLECVRICQSNGGCLQPEGLESGIRRLWAPRGSMRTGYCEYNCNLCGQVCPTGAIRKMALAEKQKNPIGLACFDKNVCIPFSRNEECIVCEEHCPIPDKAIRFEEKEVVQPDGTKSLVPYPYVVPEKCTGCGICEFKCPLAGKPGIFVTNENQQRKH